jgi:5-(carboxyamino)imidazole ribonucleotide mutase
MDDFLSNNVNAFSGDVLLCDTYVVRMYPEIVASAAQGRSSFSYAPEACHVDQLGFKLSTAFRLGRMASLDVLTKDGSPHSLQIPLIVQEAAANTSFPPSSIRFLVVEKGVVTEVSHEAVRTARHLSEVNTLLENVPESESGADVYSASEATTKFSDLWLSVLVGGRSDLGRVKSSGLLTILDKVGVRYEVSVISSEQNPEELREYCRTANKRGVKLFICIAGSVPGLPAAVKAHLPAVPVIGVPLSVPEFSARDILMASFSVPARRPIMLTGIDEVGLKKAAYLACEIIACSSTTLREQYEKFLKEATPSPDFHVDLAATQMPTAVLPRVEPFEPLPVNGNGKKV